MKSKLPPTPAPEQVSRYGITEDSPMPADLPFAPALRLLMADRDRYSIKIGIDPRTFYSEAAIDLHDFVDSIVYRFVVEEGTPNELEQLQAQDVRMAFTLGRAL